MLTTLTLVAALVVAPAEPFALHTQLDASSHEPVSFFAEVRTLPHLGPSGFTVISWIGRAELHLQVRERVSVAAGVTLARTLGIAASPLVKVPMTSITFRF